ncbi:LLM class flavin-dependent oxidoreductase [Phycicoccus jejuensis]|uniref:LLM class flavin-dependent oxidoreductase n=1 Tax=Phycicoccus jejuensis TaxID=367299 RepID=UPI00384C9065
MPTPLRPFRFGVLAPLGDDVRSWLDGCRRIADQGYSTVLAPDVPGWQPSPTATLAMAAAVTPLRVGTWVTAALVRPPWVTAWEAHSLTVLTEGRFELGLGTGRPGLGEFLAERGVPVPDPVSPSTGVELLRATVDALRDLDGAAHTTPVAVAVRGPLSRALAAEVADTVTVAHAPTDRRADVARRVREVTAVRDVEVALHVPVVGDRVAAFMASVRDTDPAALRAADSLAVLPEDPVAAAEELLRRREELDASYVVIGADAADVLAPVVEMLEGR